SVNTIQIAEALKEKGFEIDRKSITLPDEQIKEVGKYKAVIKLHRDVKVEIDFEVVPE
ncbi:MAG: 50S ribosomal protein L9, partial [Bacteroidales bacterium]|nr:50S ribosomal protein L9 [Bacteroidales bacterium]